MARLGVWITLNLATVFLPITRNSIWVIFFNISQERILHIHRFISTLCIISVIIKFIAVLILYPANFLIKIINPQTGGSPLFGTIATIIFLLCGIFAMNKIRQKMFELFYYSHRIFSISIIIFSSLHYISFLYYILPAIILYFIDLIIRYLYTTTSIYSKIQNIGDENYSCSLINITIQKNIKVFPGCYFFICFYKDISRFQWHPLSMVNYENNNMVFCAKNIGKYSWTGRLHDTIKNDTNILNNKYVYIQGPYGHISVNYRENKYDNINIISGGIGITPMISIIKDISILYNTGKLSKLKKVNFVWIIKYISILKYFKKYLINYNKNIFDIKVYITNENIENCNYSEYNYDIKIINNKPDIINLLNMEYSQYKNMVILTCGPDRMTNKILRFSNEYNIDISNEIF